MTETRTDPAVTEDAALEAHRAAIAEAPHAPADGPAPDSPPAEAPHPPADPAALRAEIELTRVQLADTVAALAAKTDVKSRVRGSVSMATGQLKGLARDAAGHARDTIGGVGDRMSNAAHLHRGGHRAGRDGLAVPGAPLPGDAPPARDVPPARVVRRPGSAPTVAAGALAGGLVGALAYLLWRGRR